LWKLPDPTQEKFLYRIFLLLGPLGPSHPNPENIIYKQGFILVQVGWILPGPNLDQLGPLGPNPARNPDCPGNFVLIEAKHQEEAVIPRAGRTAGKAAGAPPHEQNHSQLKTRTAKPAFTGVSALATLSVMRHV